MSPASEATQEKRSLRTRLMHRVLLPLALVWLIGTAITVALAHHFAQRAFDRALLDDALALASRVQVRAQGVTLDLSNRDMSALLFDQSEKMYFVVRRPDGAVIAGHPALYAATPEHAGEIVFSYAVYEGQRLRTVSLLHEQPVGYLVVVAQTTGSRQALLRDVLTYSVAPQIVLLVALASWLGGVIARELRPLSELQRSVEQRDAMDLTPAAIKTESLDIEHLTVAVNALMARVDHSIRAQREFSGNVAHELRTPLAAIRVMAEYALSRQEPEVWREQLERIGYSESRASRLVEQLLALALAEETGSSVQTTPLGLDEVVRDTVLRYMPRADAESVDLGVQGLETPVRVRGNMALIEGVLGNLLDNALCYGHAPQGEASRVTVELTREGARVHLSVIDNGPGLSLEERRRLMQRGVRGMNSERLGEGAGLGLAIVKKFAQLMQAKFELGASSEGRGLRASVTFDLLRD